MTRPVNSGVVESAEVMTAINPEPPIKNAPSICKRRPSHCWAADDVSWALVLSSNFTKKSRWNRLPARIARIVAKPWTIFEIFLFINNFSWKTYRLCITYQFPWNECKSDCENMKIQTNLLDKMKRIEVVLTHLKALLDNRLISREDFRYRDWMSK